MTKREKGVVALHVPIVPLKNLFCVDANTELTLYFQPVGDSPWFNLSLQQVQPCWFDSSDDDENALVKSCVYEDEAYLGGTCLHVEGQFNDNTRDLPLK